MVDAGTFHRVHKSGIIYRMVPSSHCRPGYAHEGVSGGLRRCPEEPKLTSRSTDSIQGRRPYYETRWIFLYGV